jgi:metal-dependent amidase/aminoacylase/carboxypeptidase family protein
MNAMTIDAATWTAAGEAGLPEAIRLRRAIHAEPELGLDLPKTTAKVKAALEGLPLEIREGSSTSGLVAILRGPANGRTVLLRGDMDALPLIEDTGLPTPTSPCSPARRGLSAQSATASPAR